MTKVVRTYSFDEETDREIQKMQKEVSPDGKKFNMSEFFRQAVANRKKGTLNNLLIEVEEINNKIKTLRKELEIKNKEIEVVKGEKAETEGIRETEINNRFLIDEEKNIETEEMKNKEKKRRSLIRTKELIEGLCKTVPQEIDSLVQDWINYSETIPAPERLRLSKWLENKDIEMKEKKAPINT